MPSNLRLKGDGCGACVGLRETKRVNLGVTMREECQTSGTIEKLSAELMKFHYDRRMVAIGQDGSERRQEMNGNEADPRE